MRTALQEHVNEVDMHGRDLQAELATAFPMAFREEIVEGLRLAYSKACEEYDEAAGSGPETFGICVYHYALRRIADASHVAGVEVRTEKPVFRLNADGFEVGCHRVGGSERDDISRKFPQNDNAASSLADPQVLLPFCVREEPRKGGVVIAHLGNPEDGLCAVYLAVPDQVDEQNRICRWAHTELLWRRGDTIAPASPIEVTLPPDENVEVPVVRRKSASKGGK